MRYVTLLIVALTGLLRAEVSTAADDAKQSSQGQARADKDKKTPPEVPGEWIVVEEDIWYIFLEEPDRYFRQAKVLYDKGDLAGAAKEIRKAVGLVKLETAAAEPAQRKPLEAAIFELEVLADEVAAKRVKSVGTLDRLFARVHHDMARYHEQEATAAIKDKDYEGAAQQLEAAGHHVEEAFDWAGEEIGTGLAHAIEAVADIAGRLLGGTDAAVAEANKAIGTLGTQLEDLGKKIGDGKKADSSKAQPKSSK